MNKAPSFSLFNQNDKEVSLDSLKGKWAVIYFYPKDNTPGCTTEACDFSSSAPLKNTCIIGVSPDSTASHRKFIEEQQLTIELLSDSEKTVMKSYGAWGEKKNYGKVYEGVIRSTFLINPEGCIAFEWKNVRAKGHAMRVLTKLRELQDG